MGRLLSMLRRFFARAIPVAISSAILCLAVVLTLEGDEEEDRPGPTDDLWMSVHAEPPHLERAVAATTDGPARTVGTIALGTVRPRARLSIASPASGEVAAVHPEVRPGGLVTSGSTMFRLVAEREQAEVQRAEAARSRASQALLIEEGRGRAARRDWAAVDADRDDIDPLDRDLAIRLPQLEEARQAVVQREADVRLARRRLELLTRFARSDIWVLSEDLEEGAWVEEGATVAEVMHAGKWDIVANVRTSDPAASATQSSLRASYRVAGTDGPWLEASGVRWLPAGNGVLRSLLVEVDENPSAHGVDRGTLWDGARVEIRLTTTSAPPDLARDDRDD